MRHRLFIAIKISKPLLGQILAWQRTFSNLPVRWVTPENLHITLLPPWYIEKVEEVVDQLSRYNSPVAKFSVSFDTVSFGPTVKRPNLIWVSGKAPRQLLDLKSSLESVLKIEPTPRPYRLHLTLARFRLRDFSSFPIERLNEKVDWRQEVTEIALLESTLGIANAPYKAHLVTVIY